MNVNLYTTREEVAKFKKKPFCVADLFPEYTYRADVYRNIQRLISNKEVVECGKVKHQGMMKMAYKEVKIKLDEQIEFTPWKHPLLAIWPDLGKLPNLKGSIRVHREAME